MLIVKLDDIKKFFMLDNKNFVVQSYLTLLGRAPDHEGFKYYRERLEAGYSRVSILDQISRSKEFSDKKKMVGLKKLLWAEKGKRHWFLRLFMSKLLPPTDGQDCNKILGPLEDLGCYDLTLGHYVERLRYDPVKADNWYALAEFYRRSGHRAEMKRAYALSLLLADKSSDIEAEAAKAFEKETEQSINWATLMVQRSFYAKAQDNFNILPLNFDLARIDQHTPFLVLAAYCGISSDHMFFYEFNGCNAEVASAYYSAVLKRSIFAARSH